MTGRPARGLGRGLDALLGNAALPVTPGREALQEIPVERITPNPFQPRKHFDPQALDELKDSIERYGVLVPIIVRARGDRYELIAGERRWRACAALMRPKIPAIVREAGDVESLEVAIVENLQREDLNAIEEAAGFQQLIDEHGLTQEQVAQRVGKSRPTVTNALRLLGLADAIKAMVVGDQLSAGHARALLAAPENTRIGLARRTLEGGISVRELERLAANAAAAQPAEHRPKPRRELSTHERDFERRLRERYGAHVTVVRTGKGGRIEFRFLDDDELMSLGDRLLSESE